MASEDTRQGACPIKRVVRLPGNAVDVAKIRPSVVARTSMLPSLARDATVVASVPVLLLEDP
jgi:hypothetical protein